MARCTNGLLSIVSPNLNLFSSETPEPVEVRFYVEHLYLAGTKVYIIGPGRMTKMATMPYIVKPFKNLLLQNRKSYDLETWQTAKGTRALQKLYK